MAASSKAVFLSYASQDADAARKICDALRGAGIEVWFDQSELVGGDQWDRYLAFRDLLRGNSEARETYLRDKEALAALHAGDRRAYTAGKAEVIARLLVDDRRA